MDIKYAKHVYILINAHRSIDQNNLQLEESVRRDTLLTPILTSEEEKEAFTTRLKSVCQLLTPKKSLSVHNYSFFNALLAAVQGAYRRTSASGPSEILMVKNIHELHCHACSSLINVPLSACA